MNPYLKRIIKTVIFTATGAAVLAYEYKVRKEVSWDQVLTTRFWIVSVLHLIPAYFFVWAFEDKYEYWTHFQVILLVIFTGWAIVFGIICLISHFVFGFDLI